MTASGMCEGCEAAAVDTECDRCGDPVVAGETVHWDGDALVCDWCSADLLHHLDGCDCDEGES